MNEDLFQAAAIHDEVSGDSSSFFTGLSDALTKGAPLAVGSGLVSMYNTGVSLGNAFGADAEKIDYGAKVADYDDDLAAYYKQHEGGVDLAGFIATSLVPGTIGIKALKMAQGGIVGANTAASTGLIKNTQSVLGIFRNAEAKFTEKALEKIRLSTNEIYNAVDSNKFIAIAAGVGEQALQGAAFQTAVLLTMNQSPILSKPDESYFTSLINNSHEILTAGLIQGVVGGTIGGLGIAGKLRKTQYDIDIEQFPSRHYTKVGQQETLGLDPGTGIAADFSFWKNRGDEFKARQEAANLTDGEIKLYKRTLNNQEYDIRERIMKDLTEGGKDKELAKAIWDNLIKTEAPEEVASTLFSAAKGVKRLDVSFQPPEEALPKIMTTLGPLAARVAGNILKRNIVAPFPVTDTSPENLLALAQNYEMYKDTSGTLHILEENKYVKNTAFREGYQNKNPTLVVKLVGDKAGQITETGYPTLGDLGKPSISKDGDLLVDGNMWQGLPETYDPLSSDPIQSNALFVKASLKPFDRAFEEGDIVPKIDIAGGDIPLLEKVAKEGLPKDTQLFYDGEEVATGDIQDLLLQEKLSLRQDLIDAGHDMKKIARELNVTEDFAESGRGDGYALSKIEDHTKPSYGVFNYETSRLPKDFEVRGISSLLSRIQLGYDLNQTIAADILGPWYDQLPKTAGTLLNISSVERFSSFLTSASPDYGGFGAAMTQAGKVAGAAKREIQQKVLGDLNGLSYQVKQSEEAKIEGNQVLNKIRSSRENMYIWPPNAAPGDEIVFVPKSIFKAAQKQDDFLSQAQVIEKALEDKEAFQIQNKDVEAFYLGNHQVNQVRMQKWNNIFAAIGSGKVYDLDEFHLPGINTRKYPYVAFVKEKMDMGAGDLKEAGVIASPTEADHITKINKMRELYGDRFVIQTQEDLTKWKMLEEEYQETPFLGNDMPSWAIKKELHWDFQPRTDDEFINDLTEWHYNQEAKIINQAIELHYAQEFAEVRAIGKDYAALAKRQFGEVDKRSQDVNNPYYNYIQTALNISNFDRYNSLWGKFNDFATGIGKKMFSSWDVMREKASAGEVDWETANKVASSYGFTPPYDKVVPSLVNPKIDSRDFQASIAKMNGAVSTLTLGLDFLNSLINVVSFPIMATAEMKNILNNVVKGDTGKVGELVNLTSVKIPGTDVQLPSPMKLLFQAGKNLFSETAKVRGQYYEDIGAIRYPSSLYLDVVDASQLSKEALNSPEQMKTWVENLHDKANALADAGKKYTGYNKAEWLVRFLGADMMKQLTEAAGVAAEDAPAYINNFTNRVHGNYLASQRPHLFQGPVGQLISLFQTYQFNIMQNMVRYIEEGDKTAALMLLGMQNTIFGLQGNPGFYILNQAIGQSNSEHIDITSGVQSIVGKDVADWMLYGLGSNAINTSLYNRGDLTPRYVTVVPTQLKDVPAIAIPVKAITAFLSTLENITQGGNVIPSILQGISHSGFNRPLAGLAQLASGQRTTTDGNLLTTYNDVNGWTVAAKLAGGEELNRAIAIDAYYRDLAYKAYDTKLVRDLGSAVKTTMYAGGQPTQEQTLRFMNEYTRASGNPQSFNRFITTNLKDANQSSLNTLMGHVNSRSGRLLSQAMGGDHIPDYYTQLTSSPSPSVPQEEPVPQNE